MPVTPIHLTLSYYAQNFDTLPSTGSVSRSELPQGWDFAETGTSADSTLVVDHGSSAQVGSHSYGADDSSDRAFGELSSINGNAILGAVFVNDSDRYMTGFNIHYVGEQWRAGGVRDQLDFQYSLDATSLTTGTWHDVNGLDFAAPNTTGLPLALNGNDPINATQFGTLISAQLAPGESLSIRWVPSDNSIFGNGLAIDNFSLQPVFHSLPPKNDFNRDGHADILWINDNGAASAWDSGQLSGAHIVAGAGTLPNDLHTAGSGAFDGFTNSLIARSDDGSLIDPTNTIVSVPTDWHVAGIGDFNGDARSDILWRNDNGAVSVWDSGQIDNAHITAAAGVVPTSWHIAGTGDFDGSGSADILWRNDNGAVSIWDSGKIDRAHIVAAAGVVPGDWHIAGSGDFNGDGHDDILWRNDNGAVSIWDSGQISGAHIIAAAGVVGNDWHIATTGDYDGNGRADILWHNDNAAVSIWDNGQIGGAHIVAAAGVVSPDWHIAV